jgi:hypothetical protein
MKIVINKCFGGFSLSAAGIAAYAKLKGWKPYFFVNVRKPEGGLDLETLVQKSVKELGDDIWFHTYKAKDHANESYFSCRDIPREDKDLVRVVEKLGKKANGRYADLGIVEIPNDVEWEIDEYDGLESIDEKHRSWG